ncbi:MAG TPA: alcohol dehydrogenase catalytic domain-containing protein, partial [Herpetosiphonaceae bacterium]
MTDDSQLIRAVRIHQYGGPEELRLEAIPRPEPKAGEVLIRVRAAGVLPADWKVREGQFRAFFPVTFPFVAGSALAGVVEAVGLGVA